MKTHVHTKTLHANIYSSFIHNCPKLEHQVSGKTHWTSYNSMLVFNSRNALSRHKSREKNLRCIWPDWKGCRLGASNCVTYWKRQSSRDQKKICCSQGLRGGWGRGTNRWSLGHFSGCEMILYDAVMMTTWHLSKPMEPYSPKASLHPNLVLVTNNWSFIGSSTATNVGLKQSAEKKANCMWEVYVGTLCTFSTMFLYT